VAAFLWACYSHRYITKRRVVRSGKIIRSGSSRFGLLFEGLLVCFADLPLDSLYWNIWLDYWIKRFTGRSFKYPIPVNRGSIPLKKLPPDQQEMFF